MRLLDVWHSAVATALLAAGLEAQQPGPRPSPLMTAHVAFAEARYEDAVRLYRRTAEPGAQPCVGRDYCLSELIEAVEQRSRLGRVAPADTHRIGLIFVTEIRTTSPDGSVRRRRDVTDEQRANWRIYAAVVRQLIESFSNGGMTLKFDEVDAVFSHSAGGPDTAWYTDQLDLERYFRDNVNNHDSYVTLSTTIPFGLGLARRYPFVAYVLYGPDRGVANINSAWDWTFLLHEWFHAVEFIAGVQPSHGYMDSIRTAFPGWRGRTEFDYFRWHFRTTLAPNWSRLSYRRRFPAQPWSSEAWSRIAAAYDTIPLERRREARRIFDLARRLADTALMVAEYERALGLSPHMPQPLYALDFIYRWRRPEKHRWSENLALVQDAEGLVPAAAAAYGTAVGSWRPSRMDHAPVELEWDASRVIDSAGTYEVTMFYTEGRAAVRIQWVTLLEDDREIARDEHPGWSGTRRDSITYRLALPQRSGVGPYAIRARLVGADGHTHTNGLVMVRRVPAPLR